MARNYCRSKENCDQNLLKRGYVLNMKYQSMDKVASTTGMEDENHNETKISFI